MAIDENIIAAYLDGVITPEQVGAAGLTMDDYAVIEEASADNETITRIAAGDIPLIPDSDLDPFYDFQLPELPIMAQEADPADEEEFVIIDYADDTAGRYADNDYTDPDFDNDIQHDVTDFPDLSGIDCPDLG